jgi:predicted nucleic acid-binding protein
VLAAPVNAVANRRFAIDTNLYIDALRTETGRVALNAFHATFAPFVHLSAVVAQELRAGARDRAAASLDTNIVSPFERRGRVFAPSYAAWKESGRVLAELLGPKDWRSVTRSFVNDTLLAMSCREAGVVLVTSNVSDFRRIAAVREFDFAEPWPTSVG